MIRIFATWLGKFIQLILRVRGSGGQALPGLIIEKIAPNYLSSMLSQIPEGVVVVTGTNGKTTTTKMIVELLEAEGKKVLTNKTGSNLTRGIVSSIAAQASLKGNLDFDLAILELDEAFAKQFVKKITPTWVVALNVSRDQLDRFGEVDAVARLIGETMSKASVGIVTNANDPHLSQIAEKINVPNKKFFGLSKDMAIHFPTDSEIVAVGEAPKKTIENTKSLLFELSDFNDKNVTFTSEGSVYQAKLKLDGQHNFLNAAAALSLVKCLLPESKAEDLIKIIENLKPAFGRGEYYRLENGSRIQLALVKNPASFRQSLASYLGTDTKVMIAINDNYADSRDTSWLWDVDFSLLKNHQVLLTTGSRAADMALRLSYDGIKVTEIQEDLGDALASFSAIDGDKLILSSYTAMLWLHKELSSKAGK